jgi:hypothetical protein
MALPERSAAAQHALTLACEAFAEATQHFRATPATKRPASKKTAAADAAIRFDIADKHFDMPAVIDARAGSLGAGAVVQRMLAHSTPHDARTPVLVTQYVSPRLADALIAADIPFLDTAGNVYLQEPEATIMIVGRGHPTLNRLHRASRSTTPKGLRVSFALLTRPGLAEAPYRTIAEHSGVALNTVNLAMDDLMERGFVVTKGTQRVIADRRRLIDDWSGQYPTRLRPKLSPRRFASLNKKSTWWKEAGALGLDARVSGEAGADILTHDIRPARLTIYSHAGVTPQLMAKGMLRPDERGDVEILETFWPMEAEQGWETAPRDVVHPLLVYTDLIASSDDRNRAVAQTVYERYLADEHA